MVRKFQNTGQNKADKRTNCKQRAAHNDQCCAQIRPMPHDFNGYPNRYAKQRQTENHINIGLPFKRCFDQKQQNMDGNVAPKCVFYDRKPLYERWHRGRNIEKMTRKTIIHQVRQQRQDVEIAESPCIVHVINARCLHEFNARQQKIAAHAQQIQGVVEVFQPPYCGILRQHENDLKNHNALKKALQSEPIKGGICHEIKGLIFLKLSGRM